MSADGEPILRIQDLKVDFDTIEGTVPALGGVDLTVRRGETLGLVGESGCGKSVTAMSVMRLLREPPARLAGSIRFRRPGAEEIDIAALAPSGKRMRAIRGGEIAMIFQEPMRALSPVFTVGHQVAEAVRLHRKVTRAQARGEAVAMLDRVGIPDPRSRAHDYAHQLSGGQRQRVMIAMALVCRPALLIADEPTTALDVTIQAQILELLADLQQELGLTILLITHDLGIVAGTCSRVNVMYAGRIVETADVHTIYARPAHPYTQGLLASVPVPGRGHRQRLAGIGGSVPDPRDLPPGCAFGPRCELFRAGLCDRPVPVPVMRVAGAHTARCYRTEAALQNATSR